MVLPALGQAFEAVEADEGRFRVPVVLGPPPDRRPLEDAELEEFDRAWSPSRSTIERKSSSRPGDSSDGWMSHQF
jgi:hypothetical protein